MESVKLRANMILKGVFYQYGSVVDLDQVPVRLRKRQYIIREGEPDPDAPSEGVDVDVERMERIEPEDSRLKARRRLQRSI
jgi:hypothetical protein